jgi:hypothetical protein
MSENASINGCFDFEGRPLGWPSIPRTQCETWVQFKVFRVKTVYKRRGVDACSHRSRVMSALNTIRAFNLTISTKGDISDECVTAVSKWINKQCEYALCIVETDTGKRHLHAALFFKEPRDKKKLRENIWMRMVKPFHPTSIGRVAVHIQAMPGLDWVKQYLGKDPNREIEVAILPDDLDNLLVYLPTEDEQVALMAATDKVLDVFYNQHEIMYKQWLTDNTWISSTETAHQYFRLRMFVRKDMRVIADSRRVHQMAIALHKYSTDSYHLTNLEISTHVRENQCTDFSHN